MRFLLLMNELRELMDVFVHQGYLMKETVDKIFDLIEEEIVEDS